MPESEFLTTEDAARLLGCEAWEIRRLFRRGLLPDDFPRAGQRRVLRRADLPALRSALKKWRAGKRRGARPR